MWESFTKRVSHVADGAKWKPANLTAYQPENSNWNNEVSEKSLIVGMLII